jgi:uncharacterized membrane protein
MRDRFKFRERAREVSRIEAFSDVVFGFALTLIVVSLEVPKNYNDLMAIMRGFPAFAICFATLLWIWHEHHKFFRRYDMRDEVTIALNAVLLFLVLFYTYPLKFIFSLVTGQANRQDGDAAILFSVYGGGFIGIFLMLFLLNWRAYKKRAELRLNEFEVHDTVTSLAFYSSYCALGLISVILGWTLHGPALAMAGWTYFLIGPVSAFIGFRRGTQRGALQSRHVQAAQTMANSSATAAVPTVAANGPTLSEAIPAPRLETAIDSVTKP